MQLDIWHVTGDGFHFGRHGLEKEESGVHFPSDSLFAAAIARMAALYGNEVVDAFGSPFLDDDPPLVMSSAFPRAGEVLFFPLPLHRKALNDTKEHAPRPKALKKIQYVSESVFRELLKDKKSLFDMWGDVCMLHDKKVLYLPGEADLLPEVVRTGQEPIWKIERRPHVTIGRAAQDSSLYHIGRAAFNTKCGLWFAIHWRNKQNAVIEQFEAALKELGDAGLGGVRSRGYGACNIEKVEKLNLPTPTADQPWLTLSRYLPKDQAEAKALSDERAAYAIETVRGWVSSSVDAAQRRRTVNMLTEGSVIGPLDTDHPGQMVDVQPKYDNTEPLGHPVWRNGIALAVGLQG